MPFSGIIIGGVMLSKAFTKATRVDQKLSETVSCCFYKVEIWIAVIRSEV